MKYASRAACIVVVYLVVVLSSPSAHASVETGRYLIHTSSGFMRKAIGGVRHDFGNVFSLDASPFQLSIAKMFNLEIEKVDALHTSSRATNDQQIPAVPVTSHSGISIAVLDTGTIHGAYVMDIIAHTGGERSDISLYKVCNDKGVCYADDVAQGIRSAVANGARIINMSFGSDRSSKIIDEAIQEADAHGVILVAAAGNGGPFPDTVEYPASNDRVIAVGALDDDQEMEEWSSRGDVDAWESGKFKSIAGTSVAAAYYTGRTAKLLKP